MPTHPGRVAKVMPNPQKHPKTGIYRLRLDVPAKLRQAVADVLGRDKPTRELLRSLDTRDPREARVRMVDALAWADGILEAARHGAKPLTDKQAHALAGLWYREQLHDWQALPRERQHEPQAAWENWDESLPDGPYPPIAKGHALRQPWDKFLKRFVIEAASLLERQGMTTDRASTEFLGYLISQRLGQALERLDQQQRGDYSPDPIRARFPALERPAPFAQPKPTEPPAVSLRTLLDRWKALSPTKPRTKSETGYIVNMLIAFLGHDDAARLTKADLRRWRDAGQTEGIENNTLNHRLGRVRQVLVRGVRDDLLPEDVSKGLELDRVKPKTWKHYSEADAARILNAARLEKRASQRWAHWIMAFTGMRVSEVLQLTAGDIRRDGDLAYIHINEDDPTKSVKTSERRNVPIHAGLIAEGFLDYVATVPGNEPLFPDKRLDENGNRGGRGWQVVGRWVHDTVGIADPEKAPDHSWRHRLSYWLRRTAADKDDRDGVLGHAEQGTGARYGAGDKYGAEGEALRRLAAAIGKVPVPAGVTFPPPPLIPWKSSDSRKRAQEPRVKGRKGLQPKPQAASA